MPRDGRFWRNVAMVTVAHLVIAIVFVRWSRGTQRDLTSVTWITNGLSDAGSRSSPTRTESAIEKSPPAAPSPSLNQDDREQPAPVPTQARSDIELPVPTPSATPAKTPEPKASASPFPKPTPKRIPTPTPGSTPKKSGRKPTPAPSPKIPVKPAEEQRKNDETAKDKETSKVAPLTGSVPSGNKSGSTGPGSGGRASEFNWYGKMLHDRFHSEWVQPTTSVPAGAKMSALVRIRIEKDGRISKFNIIRPSGNVAVDESVAAVAKRVTRVEPLPSGLGGAFYEVNINFELNPTQ